MSDRPIKLASLARSALKPSPWQSLPLWVFVSLATNGLLVAVMLLAALRDYSLSSAATLRPTPLMAALSDSSFVSSPAIGPRHQLTYSQWVRLLRQEARAVAQHPPQRLTILAGDSLSLWFPPDLLPEHRAWLNQGISGETSAGLLQRLDLFQHTQPEKIFVMIGINDLIRKVSDETLLANERQILKTLRSQHPKAEIVLQSILPHGNQQATWEGRDRLFAVSNARIRRLNQQLETIAREQNAQFLNLHPLFTDAQGNLRMDFSTDGLHLNTQGYLVWRTALEMYSQQAETKS